MVMTSIHAETISPHPLEHRVWVCALGLSTDSERVLRMAGRAATVANAKLSVIHAVGKNAGAEPRRRLQKFAEKVGWAAEVRIVVGPVQGGSAGRSARRRRQRANRRKKASRRRFRALAGSDVQAGSRCALSGAGRLSPTDLSARDGVEANCHGDVEGKGSFGALEPDATTGLP